MGELIIPQGLVGKNPGIENGIYQDSYVNEMNGIYPIKEIVGTPNEHEYKSMFIRKLRSLFNEAIPNAEECAVLLPIYISSAKNGSWVPGKLETDAIKSATGMNPEEYVEYLISDNNKRPYRGTTQLHNATKRGLLINTVYEGDFFSILTEQFAKHLQSNKT